MAYQLRQVDKGVFRAYDIRGVIGSQLDEHAYYSIGKAIACRLQELGRDAIFLARDGRLSSENLAKALASAFIESGITVYDLGAVATPVMYFAANSEKVDSGLMVTGSHNPADYNGIKIVLAGNTLAHEEINYIFELVQKGQFIQGTGHYQTFPILPQYTQRIVNDIQLKRPLKVVVDCGNGIAGATIPVILEQLGCTVIPLFCEVDGRFPNHHPDPAVEANLADLKQTVLAEKADIGLAFDGDADRLGVVTDTGEVIWPDRLMMLYAQEVLSRNPKATIVYDVKCSSHLEKTIKNAGGIAKMCPTGHSIVKKIMRQENAALAGEMSGHLFFKDRWYGFDDALYSACRLLEIISQSSAPISQQFSTIPNSINTPEIKIPIEDNHKFSFMQRFSENVHFPNAELIRIDGVRAEFSNGWGLLRASNTTPCLIARFEARDAKGLDEIQALFKAQLHAIDETLAIPF